MAWAIIGEWLYAYIPLIGGIGGIVGCITAIVASVLLWKTLKETRKQTQLGYKGVLGVSPGTDVNFQLEFESKEKLKQITVTYKFIQNNSAILLLRVREWLFDEREKIDVDSWYEQLKPKLKEKILTPVIPNQEFGFFKEALESTKKFYSLFSEGNRNANNRFYVHGIFAYEDLTHDIYWIYIRWSLNLSVIGHPGQEDLKINSFSNQEEYRFLTPFR